MSEKIYDLIIIGGGPAGLTAAVYAARADLNTLVVAGSPPGGQLMLTTDVENFPGFPDGIMGPELITNMRTQAERFNAEFVDENVENISGSHEQNFTAKTEGGNQYYSKSIIVATGASARWLNLENEQRLRGKGVSACAVCDGFFFKDKVVAMVGGGDASMEEAIFLTKFVEKVYLIARSSKEDLRASAIMQRRAFDNPKIEFIFNTQVTDVLGENSVEGLELINNKSRQKSKLDVQGLFLAIGHIPNTKFLKGFLDLGKMNYVKVINNTKTEKEGVFVAGDVADYLYRQAITAAGFGCMAALEAERFLAHK